jgi:transcriptional regulator with XRE-family HTH domain
LISTKKGIIIKIGGDDMQSINLNFIKTRRKELGLTLQQMSDSLGFKKATTYSNYENGDRIMKANMLPTLAQILQCDIMDFFH